MPEVKVTPFRFTDEELELLGVIEGHTGVRSSTEALRRVREEHARGEGGESAPKSEQSPEASPDGSKDEGQ
jgi:hypothetical protein